MNVTDVHCWFFPYFFEIFASVPVKSVKQKRTRGFQKTRVNVAGAAVSPSDFIVVDAKVRMRLHAVCNMV